MNLCELEISVDPARMDLLVEKFGTKIREAGGTLTYNKRNGTFILPTQAGKISGAYTVSEDRQRLAIDVLERPALIKCAFLARTMGRLTGYHVKVVQGEDEPSPTQSKKDDGPSKKKQEDKNMPSTNMKLKPQHKRLLGYGAVAAGGMLVLGGILVVFLNRKSKAR